MANIFSANEIVQLGIQIEINGKDFYGVLAVNAKDKKAAGIFKLLQSEEEKHIGIFQKLLEKTKKYEPPSSTRQEYFAYMNAIAGDYVFTQKGAGKEIANKITHDVEAIEFGMGFEKDSILFYESMKKAVSEGDIKIVGELVRQEQMHLSKLAALRESI